MKTAENTLKSSFQFVPGMTGVVETFCPTVDEPIAIRVIKSGWSDLYHVLVEYGDYEQTDYHLLTEEQIQEKFGVILQRGKNPAIAITLEDAREEPNDAVLGEYIRYTLSNACQK